jgi:phage gp29-like protein
VSSEELRTRPDKYHRAVKTPIIRQLSTWTVDEILDTQDAHERGQMQQSGLLWLWMQRTSRLKAVLRKRAGALSSLPFQVDPASGSEDATPEELAVASLIEKQWFEILPEPTLKALVRAMVGQGVALARVTWCDDGVYWWPRLTVWPCDALYYRDSEQVWYARTREGGDRKICPGAGWLLWLPDGPLSFQTGSVLSLALPCLLSTLADSDWANYNAANAQIVRKVTVPRGATRASKDAFLDSVEGLGRDTSAVLCERNLDQSGFDFEYVSAGGTSTLDTFQRAKDDAAKQITIEILGQEKTTDLGQEGARSAVESLQSVEDAIIAADAASLSTAIREQILKPLCEYNWGSPELAPWPKWEIDLPADAAIAAKTDLAMAQAADAITGSLQGTGKALDVLAYFERAGVPMIDAPVETPAADPALDARPRQ